MNRKLMTGWILLCLGVAQIGGGWLLAHQAQSASAPLADDELIRIHVIANSDSAADQALKLQVRDAVLASLAPSLAGVGSTAGAEAAIRTALPTLEQEAAVVIEAEGYSYTVKAELGEFDFPGKAYESLYLPAGRYKAVRVLIGAAEGANFWCLVYPSFCYTISEVQASERGTSAAGNQEAPEQAADTGCDCDKVLLNRSDKSAGKDLGQALLDRWSWTAKPSQAAEPAAAAHGGPTRSVPRSAAPAEASPSHTAPSVANPASAPFDCLCLCPL